MRLRAVTIGATCLLTLLGSVGTATAAPHEASVTDQLSATLLGPVGVVAVVVGLTGLTVGLVRHRRRATRHVPAPPAAHRAQPLQQPR